MYIVALNALNGPELTAIDGWTDKVSHREYLRLIPPATSREGLVHYSTAIMILTQ